MDPQEILFEDPRVITTIRIVGFLVSELLALVAFFVYFGLISSAKPVLWMCWPIGIGMVVVGLLQGFWNPYTKQRVLTYVYAYCFLGFFLSVFILGFPTVIFLGWLLLMMVMDIYFNRRVAAVGMVSMSAAAVGWLVYHSHGLTADSYVRVISSSVTVISIVFINSSIWQLTLDTINKLKSSQTKEVLEHQRLTSLINSVADAVIAVDEKINIVLYNGAALNLLDVNTIKVGSNLGSLLKPVDKNSQPRDVDSMVKGVTVPVTSRDLRLQSSDGTFVNLYLSIAPVHLGYGAEGRRGYVLLMRDITREKSLEEERDEFISVVSHELRTPVAITEGNISNAQFTADKTGDMSAIKQALQEAHNQVLFLADIINDLSTLSRAERGKLKVEVEAVDVHALIKELASNYTAQAEAKGLKFQAVVDPKLELLYSSKLYTREILQNFITNAIKYTAKGHITLQATAESVGVRFAVEDTGIGISKGDQKRVYDKFFRSEDFRTRKEGGTGLGLYVTMKLARLLHAEIDLNSELDKGSTFSIFVPNLGASAAPDSTLANEK